MGGKSSKKIISNQASSNEQPCEQITIVLVGDAKVGKSSILLQYIKAEFNKNLKYTVGVDFKIKNGNFKMLYLKKGKIQDQLKLQTWFWDVGGYDKINKTVGKTFLKGADGIILVYDVNNPYSFASLQSA